MKHPYTWTGFALCLAVVLAAMGWISLTALQLDRAEAEARRQESEALRKEAEARRQAALEENVRLALWRIDTTLAPLISQESARPYFAYSSFLTIDRAVTRMFNNDRSNGETLIPSPLLSEASPNILVYFQFEPDGKLTSPQIPVDGNRKLAVPQHVSQQAVARAEEHLARLSALVDRDKLLAMLPEHKPASVAVVMNPNPLEQTPKQRDTQRAQRLMNLEQYGRGAVEYQQRNQTLQNSAQTSVGQQAEYNNFSLNGMLNSGVNSLTVRPNGGNTGLWPQNNRNNGLLTPTDIGGVLMTPLWIDGQLTLARRIAVSGREYIQGCLLNWPAIKASLLETIEDLLPKADLEPAVVVPGQLEARMLAALPVRLVPGPMSPRQLAALPEIPDLLSVGTGSFLSPILVSLGIAWVCVLLAAVAVAGLLAGVMRLSERRASFVSAVTHELRTPLTTFQMYAEMLSEGMVPEPQQQQRYLHTLRAESLRLTHLVENVLSYARLERGRANGRIEQITLDELIGPMRSRLAGRAEEAGMELVVEVENGAAATLVRANPSAVEQVLFNLVDNACKYAASAADKRIHLSMQPNGKVVQLSLRDHGPGVSAAARRCLFRSFSKSAHEAARTAPGVGLGLALSRRLARDMGGDLRLDHRVTDGACFVLTLSPAAG